MAVNNFLPFCPTDTGTNLMTQSDYAAAADRTSGNKPGVAKSALNNKALRQANYITSQIAQYIADKTGTDVLDNAVPAQLLSQINAAMVTIPPRSTRYTSGSGTHSNQFYFFIASGNATAGATYTNNAFTFTVVTTIAAGTVLKATGTGVPTVSGTLTKSGGTGDASISFYAMRQPAYLIVRLVGGGGGGAAGAATGGFPGTAGGSSSFGSSLLTSGGGSGGVSGGGGGGGAGGGVTVNSPAVSLVAYSGFDGGGSGGANNVGMPGGMGGASYFGCGSNGAGAGSAQNPPANTGSGGGGGGGGSNTYFAGSGGGGGGFIEAAILTPNATYAYVVGAAGGGTSNQTSGANGGSGIVIVEEYYQ